jgi:hypothetical protein
MDSQGDHRVCRRLTEPRYQATVKGLDSDSVKYVRAHSDILKLV